MSHDVRPTGSRPLYGPQTELGVRNFPALGRTLGDLPAFVSNFVRVKLAAARVNHRRGTLDQARRDAIGAACEEIIDGRHADQFPTALVHGGGGTTTNMNVNEVVAARATELAGVPVHPNDHVNASQSTNDTYPTAMAMTLIELADAPLAAVEELAVALDAKAVEYAGTPHLGRTCLQDAVVLTAGDTHRAQSTAVRRAATSLRSAVLALAAVPIGATAVGTGVGAPEDFGRECAAELAALTGRPVTPAADLFDALANLDGDAVLAAATEQAAMTLARIARDIRLLSSGPGGGLGDVTIPAVQAGSSIMPSKVNPVIPEYVMQLGYRISGHAQCVRSAVGAGELELNVMEPVVLDALTRSLDDLDAAARTLAHGCVEGLAWDGPHLERNVSHALDRFVQQARRDGYDATAAQRRERNV